jgi:hypothetical protein
MSMTYKELKEILYDQATICRAALPLLAEKPETEKSLDDQGLEFMMSGFLFLYDDYPNPSTEQMEQLRQTAAACAETYRGLMAVTAHELEGEDEAVLNLANGFLMLYSFKVSNNKAKMN